MLSQKYIFPKFQFLLPPYLWPTFFAPKYLWQIYAADIRYSNISSVQLLFQQIIIILVNSNFYFLYDFSSIQLPLTP